MRAKVVKNKVAPPFRVAEFDMMHTNGISYEGDMLDLGVMQKVVVRSGTWFKYGETCTWAKAKKSPHLLAGESKNCGRDQGQDYFGWWLRRGPTDRKETEEPEVVAE